MCQINFFNRFQWCFINMAELRRLLEEKYNYLKFIKRGFIISAFKDSMRVRIQLAKNQQRDSLEILWTTPFAVSMRMSRWVSFLEIRY